MNLQNITEQIIDIEVKTVSLLKNSITQDLFDSIHEILKSKGRLVITGIGKSALVGQKLVATFNSTGTPALFMHAGDALHGDLGMIGTSDIILLISKSGETREIKTLLPMLKQFNNKLIAMVGNTNSYLAKSSDFVLHTPIEQEADPFDLIPTASIISQIAMGHVLAISLLQLRGFTKEHFAKFHPGGMIGKSLLMKVEELTPTNTAPQVQIEDSIDQVIIEISNKRLGATAVLSGSELKGIITDGDLRRMLQKRISMEAKAGEVMSASPKSIEPTALVTEALNLMNENNITQLLVTSGKQYIGMIHLHDILKEGFL